MYRRYLSSTEGRLPKVVCKGLPHICQPCEELGRNSRVRKTSISALRDSSKAGCSVCNAIFDSVHTYGDSVLGLSSFIKNIVGSRLQKIELPNLNVTVHMRSSLRSCRLNVTLEKPGKWGRARSFDIFPVFEVSNDDLGELNRMAWTRFKRIDQASLLEHVDFSLISEKLHHCLQEHLNCGPSETSFKPSRLLHVGDEETEPHLAVDVSNPVSYAALSYCWGDVSGTLKATQANFASLQTSISIPSLPQVGSRSLGKQLGLIGTRPFIS